VNRQVTGDLPFAISHSRYLLALERYRRMLLDVQKVRALQMSVPLFVQGTDPASVNDDLNARLAWIIGIVLDRALNIAEPAANIGDHHVARDELGTRMCRIDFVSCFQSVSFRTVCVRIYLDVKIDVSTAGKDSNRSAKRNVSPENDTSATHVWLVLWKAARAVEQNAINSVSRVGLGLSDFAVLEALLHKGPQSVNVIGKRILLTSGSITTAIDRLEARKLVQRTPHPEDQRARLVQLTARGKRIIEDAFRQHALDMEETMAVLTPGERLELTRLLKKVGIFAATRTTVSREAEGSRSEFVKPQ
jgi:MarR family transcriptional regulator, 2-MHQ and catechol-resistance regulon repressor